MKKHETTKILAMFAAALVALCVMLPGHAEARTLQASEWPAVSIPYVDDVNPANAKHTAYYVTFCAFPKSNAAKKGLCFKVTDLKTKKAVKVTRVSKKGYVAKLKVHRLYRVSVKAKGTKSWRSIRYGVEG